MERVLEDNIILLQDNLPYILCMLALWKQSDSFCFFSSVWALQPWEKKKKNNQKKRSLDVLSWRQRLWKSFQGACVPKHAVLSQPEVITVFIRWFYYKYDLGLSHKQILYVCFWTFWWLQSAKFQIGILIVWWLNYSLLQILKEASGPMCLTGDKFS